MLTGRVSGKNRPFFGVFWTHFGGSPGTPKNGSENPKIRTILARNRLSDQKIVIFWQKPGISIKCARWPSFWEKSAFFRGFLGGPQGPPENPENRPDFSQKLGGKSIFKRRCSDGRLRLSEILRAGRPLRSLKAHASVLVISSAAVRPHSPGTLGLAPSYPRAVPISGAEGLL